MRSLQRGEKAKLAELARTDQLTIEVAVSAQKIAAFAIACFGVDAQDKLLDDRYFIFHNRKMSPCGGIANLAGGEGNQERFAIDLQRLPSAIGKLIFVITADALTGATTMAQIQNGYFRMTEQGRELARFDFVGTDFHAEKALIVAEIYRKDAWRLAAIGQGFNGGLGALIKHYGGVESIAVPAPPPTAANARRLVSLEKRIEKEAPQLLNLGKKLAVSLEKKRLQGVIAQVALVLDASGSMIDQYERGDMQLVVDRMTPLAVHFDDDGKLDTWVFAKKAKKLDSITLTNVAGYVNREWKGWKNWMWELDAAINNEPKVMREVVRSYWNSRVPAFVIFISDGGVGDNEEIAKILVDAAKYPIFWQFVGLGGSNYGILEHFDTMPGRLVDNCNFFALDDIHSIADDALYDRLLNEFPDWLKSAAAKRIILS